MMRTNRNAFMDTFKETVIFTIATVSGFAFLGSCSKNINSGPDVNTGKDYKQEMRNFVTGISRYTKSLHPGFYIIPQNGQELVTVDGTTGGINAKAYLDAIDGQGREDLFYGYERDDIATPPDIRNYLMFFLNRLKQAGKTVLVTDYCSSQANMTDSYLQNSSKGYVSFAADHRELDNIPSFPAVINGQNTNNVTSLSGAKNFLYLINPSGYTKSEFINTVNSTNYDLVIMDLFINDEQFSAADIKSMRHKKNGATRLLICYMSIGEAEDYRYYWTAEWSTSPPSWLGSENPQWPGNYLVKYWDKNWQNIIYGNDQSYAKKILDANFDGVYLDVIDAFENYQK
jgi:cysteinyl-tRNA synthetase